MWYGKSGSGSDSRRFVLYSKVYGGRRNSYIRVSPRGAKTSEKSRKSYYQKHDTSLKINEDTPGIGSSWSKSVIGRSM